MVTQEQSKENTWNAVRNILKQEHRAIQFLGLVKVKEERWLRLVFGSTK